MEESGFEPSVPAREGNGLSAALMEIILGLPGQLRKRRGITSSNPLSSSSESVSPVDSGAAREKSRALAALCVGGDVRRDAPAATRLGRLKVVFTELCWMAGLSGAA